MEFFSAIVTEQVVSAADQEGGQIDEFRCREMALFFNNHNIITIRKI